jgi:hypothetical protein
MPKKWYSTPTIVSIGNGAKLNIHSLSGQQRVYAIQEIRNRLGTKWGMPLMGDMTLEEIGQELANLGYSLPDTAAKLGDDRHDLTESQRLDKERKARGDLAEVLAAMTQEDIKGVPREDIFLVFQHKITISAPEHGTDLIAFRFDKSHTEVFPNESETITLGESKYSSSTLDLKMPCGETRSWILNRLTRRRLYAELTNIAEQYNRFGKEIERHRTLGFIPSIIKRDERLLICNTCLYGDSVGDEAVVSSFESHILDALNKHPEGAIPHSRFEAMLFKTVSIEEFCVSCYEGFSI